MTEVGKLFEASVNANLGASEPTTAAEKELQKLGVDLSKAEKDGSNSYFNVNLSITTLKENGYKRIHTNSDDPTSTVYTNGTWVINLVACTGGFVSIYKLGPKAKETIDAGNEFDVFNNSLEESLDNSADLYNKVVELYLNGDSITEVASKLNISRADVKVCVDYYLWSRKKRSVPKELVTEATDKQTNLEESDGRSIAYTAVEYTYNGDDVSDFKGHIRVRTDDEKKAIDAARKYVMNKHPEDEPRHFVVTSDTYNNVDVIDSDGDYLTTLE